MIFLLEFGMISIKVEDYRGKEDFLMSCRDGNNMFLLTDVGGLGLENLGGVECPHVPLKQERSAISHRL